MNEESLFHLALEKPPGERAAFLAEACAGDATLRQRLEILLQAHDAPGSLLERPAAQDAQDLRREPNQRNAQGQANGTDFLAKRGRRRRY